MGLGHSPRIVTENLVLLLDAANPRNFNLTAVEVLVVAGGGGGGGGDVGSGGGAGGLIYSSVHSITPGSAITATVGDGGAGSSTYNIDGSNGGNSVFGALTAIGGGGGASWSSGTGQDGGSGGGGVGGSAGGLGTAGQGFAGGTGVGSPDYPQGGGGGAGGPGQTATNHTRAGDGGIGLFFPQFSSVGGNPAGWFAGGGGGGVEAGQNGNSVIPGNGGLGGGGNGGRQGGTAIIATAGSPNTGGGGGGTDPGTGGAGGSGIVIVRYPGPQKAIGGTVTSVGGDTIHTFTTSGNFTPLVNTNGSAVLGLSDLSGNRNFGTTAGSPTYNSANGGSLYFEGSDEYVDVIETTDTFSGSFTVNLWYYAKINTGGYRIFFETNGYRVSSGAGLAMYQYDDFWSIWGRPTTNGSNTNMINTSAGSLGLNVWKNITLTRDINTGSLVLYLNGVSSGSYSGNTADYYELNTTRKYNIGGGRTAYFSNSNISQVSIYNRALTAAEITQNFNALRGRYGI